MSEEYRPEISEKLIVEMSAAALTGILSGNILSEDCYKGEQGMSLGEICRLAACYGFYTAKAVTEQLEDTTIEASHKKLIKKEDD